MTPRQATRQALQQAFPIHARLVSVVLHPRQSQAIARIGYNSAHHVLEVQFRSGQSYRYAGVPRVIVRRLLRAQSKGRAFQRYVMDVYPYTRMGPD